MHPRDDTVGVDALCSAADDGVKVFFEVDWYEVGVEFLRREVTKVLGILGVVVTSDAPRQLIFGQISRDEFDWVKWVGLARLSGRDDPVINQFLRDLREG